MADWALATEDPQGLPFLIVDKQAATLYVFDADGRLAGASAILLGMARGDDSVPGIGERPMSQIRPQERTTPAGRFVAERGMNSHGEDIMWVDYDAAVSMHRVRATNPKERRLERLRTPTIDDNRISYGCINVPARFYDRHVVPAFADGHAIVYVLPETRSLREQFGVDVAAPGA
ncbi:MAG TPA: L,D-transpeptidase [Zeimonas sp.]